MKTVLTLKEAGKTEESREAFSKDMVFAVEKTIDEIPGVKGILIRKTYQAVKKIRPNYVSHVLFVMSPDFIEAYSPLHDQFLKTLTLPAESVASFEPYMRAHKKDAFVAFLEVSDRYAEPHKNSVIGKAYATFRSQLKDVFELGIPAMCSVIDQHTIVDA